MENRVLLIALVIFVAPIALAFARLAVWPCIVAAILSGLGIAAVAIWATEQTSMALLSPEYRKQTDSLLLIGAVLWLGAVITGAAGYIGGGRFSR